MYQTSNIDYPLATSNFQLNHTTSRRYDESSRPTGANFDQNNYQYSNQRNIINDNGQDCQINNMNNNNFNLNHNYINDSINQESISFALDEIGAIINSKDFQDLAEQKPNIVRQESNFQYNNNNNNTNNNQQLEDYRQEKEEKLFELGKYNHQIQNTANLQEEAPVVNNSHHKVFYQNQDQQRQQTPNNHYNNSHIKEPLFEDKSMNNYYENPYPPHPTNIDNHLQTHMTDNYNMMPNNQRNNQTTTIKANYLFGPTLDDNDDKSKPFVEIVEQPAKCALRFRYKCEGRSAGSLPGVNATSDNKTFPSIKIHNYVGRAVVVISCVTKDAPYKAHPHNIVGKEGCKKGICTLVINNEENMVRSFPSLGIQCVKRKDIEESLSLRESINVDPFRTGFAHKMSASNIDLNVVRLCFQVFIEGSTPNKYDVPLTPIVSDPIHDKKAMSDLIITKLSHCSAPATGGREVILLCDRISKDDIQIRFYEERDGKLIWETYSELSPTDVHKQVAICFKTPKYYNENITQPVMVRIQLKRVSDNQVSEPRMFQFLPCESDEDIISRKRQKIEWVSINHHALDNILQGQNNL